MDAFEAQNIIFTKMKLYFTWKSKYWIFEFKTRLEALTFNMWNLLAIKDSGRKFQRTPLLQLKTRKYFCKGVQLWQDSNSTNAYSEWHTSLWNTYFTCQTLPSIKLTIFPRFRLWCMFSKVGKFQSMQTHERAIPMKKWFCLT